MSKREWDRVCALYHFIIKDHELFNHINLCTQMHGHTTNRWKLYNSVYVCANISGKKVYLQNNGNSEKWFWFGTAFHESDAYSSTINCSWTSKWIFVFLQSSLEKEKWTLFWLNITPELQWLRLFTGNHLAGLRYQRNVAKNLYVVLICCC